jgi:hypothetical protein
MKMNHTPGPWNVERPYGENGLYVVAPNTGIIAKMWEPDSGYGSKAANAQLMASAPKLLEALQAVVRESGLSADDLDPEISTHRPLIAAYAAIAKATQA